MGFIQNPIYEATTVGIVALSLAVAMLDFRIAVGDKASIFQEGTSDLSEDTNRTPLLQIMYLKAFIS